MNLSRCRRLVVVLSDAFPGPGLVQSQLPVGPALGWAGLSRAGSNSAAPCREGLCRLLELTRRPIFITFEGQRRDPAHPALRLLRQHRHRDPAALEARLCGAEGRGARGAVHGALEGRLPWVSCPEEWALGVEGGQGLYVLAPAPPSPIHVVTHVNCPTLPPDAFLRFLKELRLALTKLGAVQIDGVRPQTRLQTTRTPC